MVLLPQTTNKLMLSLRGPYKIVKKQTHLGYLVQIDGRVSPLHVNLLKKYHARNPSPQIIDSPSCSFSETLPTSGDISYESVNEDPPVTNTSFRAFFNEFPIEHETELCELVFTNDTVAYAAGVVHECGDELECELKTPLTVDERSKVKINPLLDRRKVEQVNHILSDFSNVLTSSPGHTVTVQHEILVSSNEVIRVKAYKLSFESQEFVKEEIKKLLELNVIEPSVCPFCSPIVLVKKKDGSLHLCIDFRKLNSVTILDATNIPLPEDLFAHLSDSMIFSSCDLSKAYW